MAKAIVFEVDGTLMDSNVLRARAWQEALARYGRQVKLAKVLEEMARRGDQLVSVFLTGDDAERYADELASFHRALFREDYLPQVKPFPGAIDLLRRLKDDGKQIALASTADPDELERYIELLGAERFIDACTTDQEVDRSRLEVAIPAAALRLLAMERAGDALAIVGSPYDAAGAVRVGMPCLGLVCGGASEEELRAAGARAIFATPQDLLTHYAESPLATA